MELTAPDRGPFGFEPVEHTADIGLRAWGRTLEELFAQAGTGMASLLVDPDTVRTIERRPVSLLAQDLEEGLIELLQEILYVYEVEHLVPATITVDRVAPTWVVASILGEALDRSRHETRTDIKAATYHDLRIRTVPDVTYGVRYETVVIFDI